MNIPPIKDAKLLRHALTHRSYVNEHPEEGEHNERLEFLGDAVLGFIVGQLLYEYYPEMSEAQLTRLRATLVDETQLTKFAKELNLGQKLYLGKGAEKDGGRFKPSLLSDAFEAMIAAYFLDSGMNAVREYLKPLLFSVLNQIVLPDSSTTPTILVDSKNRFQQWALANFQENPQYSIIDESGLDHAKEFTAQVAVNGKSYGIGKGHRKQEAEKRAAENALKNLGVE